MTHSLYYFFSLDCLFFLSLSTKLAMLSNSLPQKKVAALPSLTSQPHQVLASDLVPYSDVQQVTQHQRCCRLTPGGGAEPRIAAGTINRPSVRNSRPLEIHSPCMCVCASPQVSKVAAYAYSAISQIKVDAKEDLVVQFAIP